MAVSPKDAITLRPEITALVDQEEARIDGLLIQNAVEGVPCRVPAPDFGEARQWPGMKSRAENMLMSRYQGAGWNVRRDAQNFRNEGEEFWVFTVRADDEKAMEDNTR